jgi:hypothetical protein
MRSPLVPPALRSHCVIPLLNPLGKGETRVFAHFDSVFLLFTPLGLDMDIHGEKLQELEEKPILIPPRKN